MTISFKNDKQRKAAFANMKNRSVQALNRDNSVRAAHTLSDTPGNRDLWAANPRRIDIEGIDTPMKKIRISASQKDDEKEGGFVHSQSEGHSFSNEDQLMDKETFYKQTYWFDPNRGKHPASGSGRLPTNIVPFIESDAVGENTMWKVVNPHTHEIRYYPYDQIDKAKDKYNSFYDEYVEGYNKHFNKNKPKSDMPTDFKVDSSLINKDLAMQAHRGTSFDPELRGKQEIESFEIEMNKAYKTLSKGAKTPEQKAILDEEMPKFQENYAKKQNELLSSKSRIVSPMITGPANFPTRRNQKANDAYHNKYGQFMEWESKTLGSIGRKMERHEKQKHIESAGGEVALMKQNLKNLENRQEEMKNTNKIIRKKIPEDEKIKHLEDIGIKSGMGKLLIETGGYETYQMSNNNANIKRMKERVIEMEKRESTPTSTIKFTGGEIIDNNKDERVQIFFEDKPDEDMRKKMKGEGWRWAPSTGAWQRKRTDAALYSAKRLTGV